MYWEKELETMPRRELEALQARRLRRTVGRVRRNVPFYRDKILARGSPPVKIDSLYALGDLPFTTIEELRESYPSGLLSLPVRRVTRLHTSSGTTGKPKAIFFSRGDVDRAAQLIARCLVMSGFTRDDILQNMMTYGLFTGALVMHYGAEKIGAMVIPAGPGNSERQILLMRDFRTTALHFTPSFALYMAQVMSDQSINPREDLALRRAYTGAEPYSEATRDRIEEFYGIDVFNCYGLSEMNGPGVAFECPRKEGLHLWEDHFLMEIINPETGATLPEGEEGELVLTTLTREAMPILRYRTHDITRILPGPCPCGRTHRRIARITGRSDDMFILRGVNIFPQQIESVLMDARGVARNYQIVLEEYDRLVVRVEVVKEIFDGHIDHLKKLQADLCEKIRSRVMVRPVVELVEPGSLPVSEGKARRVFDNRKI